jgi:hypothetical protein
MKKLLLTTALILAISLPACRERESTEADAGKSAPESSKAAEGKPVPISITFLYPPSAAAGVPFQVLKDGSSSIGVAGAGFSKTSVVYFDERPLKTNYQHPGALDATIPNDLIAKQGKILVTVRDPNPAPRRSEPSPFEVVAPRARGVVPKASALYPGSVKASDVSGQAQPDKTFSIGVAGSGFGPKTTFVFDGRSVRTLYQSPNSLIAYVPVDLLAARRKVTVTLEDPEAPAPKAAGLPFEVK